MALSSEQSATRGGGALPTARPVAPATSPWSRVTRYVERRPERVFPAPAVLFLLLTMVFPIAYTLYMSVQQWEFSALNPPTYIGLANYVEYLTLDPRFWPSVGRTFSFTILAVAVETVLGVAIALIFNREFLGKGIIRTIFLFPMVATPVAIALVWATMFDPNLGVLNYFVERLGFDPILWTSDADLVLPALALVDIWEWTPFITLITLAGLSSLPSEPYEAARIDGASPARILWDLTLPMLRPTIVVAVLFRAIDALKTFDIIQVITQGGADFSSETLNIYAFQNAFNYYRLGYASSVLVFFFLLVMGVSILLLRFRRAAE
jgi:multiple sugar transport system permease protein